jgi:enoyl-CoA hydratase/3-hydroxyacyl-CoA dehydrogenase
MIDERGAHPVTNASNPFLIDPEAGFPGTIAVIGAGTIGPDIAYFFKHTRPDIELVLVDIDPDALVSAEEQIAGLVDKGLRHGHVDEADEEAVRDIEYTSEYAAIGEADLVIEAVTEDLDIKREVVAEVEATVSDDCVITSNTSSIPAERIFAEAERPERTTITHFFAPAWRNPVVELINWPGVDSEHLDYLYWLFGALGKLPLVVEDELAFMLDRVFVNWCNEAGKLLDEATAAQIDATAEEFLAAGPFAVLNLANGNPVHVKAGSYMAEENEAYEPANVFRSVDTWDTADPGTDVAVPAELRTEIRDRLLGVLFSQATDVVDRGIATPADVNVGCEAALGFESGPFDIMSELGFEEVNRILEEYRDLRPNMPTPDRELAAYGEFDRHLVSDRVGAITVITVRRLHRGNILSLDVFSELERALRRAENDAGVDGVVLTGFGPDAFSSGWEIDSFREVLGDYDRSLRYARGCSQLFEYMEGLELPVVAAINGHALGAAVELSLRCDALVATDDTFLQFPEVTLGILPGIGGIVVPYRRWPEVPAETFSDMIRFAERLPTTAAANLGLIETLAGDHAELLETAVDHAADYDGHVEPLTDRLAADIDIEPPEPTDDPVAEDGRRLSPTVDAIVCDGTTEAAAADSLPAAFEAGYEAFAQVATTEAAREGVEAFIENRSADLRGATGAD